MSSGNLQMKLMKLTLRQPMRMGSLGKEEKIKVVALMDAIADVIVQEKFTTIPQIEKKKTGIEAENVDISKFFL